MAGFEIVNKRKEIKLNKVLQPVAVYFLLLAVFAGYISVFEVEISFLMIGIVLVFSTMLSYYIQFIKWNIKTAITIVVILIVIGLCVGKFNGQNIFISLSNGMGQIINSFLDLYNQYYKTDITVNVYYVANAEILQALFMVQFLLGIIASFVIRKGKGLFFTFILALVPVILAAIVGYMPSVNALLCIIASMVFYVICYKNQNEILNKKELALSGILLVTIFAISLVSTPFLKNYVDEHEKQYQSVRSVLNQFPDSIINGIGDNGASNTLDYSEGGIGKGDFTKLSQFKPSGKQQMVITVTEKPTENVYLRGYASTEYTSEGWNEMSISTFSKLISPLFGNDKKRMLLSEPFQRVDGSSQEIKKQHIYISLENASTEYSYVPYYAMISNEDEIVKDAYVKGDGKKEYEYEYYPRYDVERLENTKLGEASKLWEDYKKFVREEYMDYPDNLELLEGLCGILEYNSKEELSYRIDYYFEKNLSYSYSPGKCPENEDFIEYFLFENHKGFCVHFATAATIMYRMCGYPSRYMEGYMITSDEFELQNDGTYKAYVTDKMAHAWSEVFDEEKGWQVMEHTLGYVGEESNTSENIITSNYEAETMTTQNNDNVTNNVTTDSQEETTSKTKTSEEMSGTNEMPDTYEMDDGKFSWKFIVFMCVVLVLLIVFQRRIRRKRKIRSFRKVKQNIGITNIYNEVYSICVFYGLNKYKKTDREVIDEIKSEFLQLEPEEWDWMYECARKAAFDSKHIGINEQRHMYELYKKFRNKIRLEMSFGKRILFLYIRAM